VVVPSLDFHLYYLNRLGELVAKVRTGVQSYDGSPAEFSNGTVVVPFERGTILFLSDTGDVVGRWEDPSGVPFRSTPVELSDGRVSICSSSMGVYFLNSESVIGKRAAP
jgi:outer membrane protein assembly factor BamB